MRRAVPTTSIAIAFHVVVAVTFFTARPATKKPDAIAKGDDVVEVPALLDRATPPGEMIVAAPGGGALLVTPRAAVAPAVRDLPPASAPAIDAPETTASSPEAAPTVAVMPPVAIGIGGSNPFLGSARMGDKPSSPSVKPAMRANPVVEKPVIAALEEATRSSSVAVNGHAVFLVKAEAKEGDCAVVSVDLLDREGQGWDDARKVAYDRLRGKKLAVPAGTKVALLSIEITSAYRLPTEAEIGGRLGENDMPELALPDPSTLGAQERRVVSSRVVRATYL